MSVRKLQTLRDLLAELTVLVNAQMPAAQAKLEKGDDLDFDRVTVTLECIGEAEAVVRDLLVAETGDPSFGL